MEAFNLHSPPPASETPKSITEVATGTVIIEVGGEETSRADTSRELVTADFRDAASVRASRKKRMARQRRSVGSVFPLPPLLPKLTIHSPSPVSRDRHLRFLLQKELQNSDVSSLGRMVLPKISSCSYCIYIRLMEDEIGFQKEAEAHLPILNVRDGIMITMEDMETAQAWNFKYRYWPNNKSRMYILEHIGEFIKTNGLRCGDVILIFKDDHTQKYLIQAKKIINCMPCSIFPPRKSLSGKMTDRAHSTNKTSSSWKMKDHLNPSIKESNISKTTEVTTAAPSVIDAFCVPAMPDAEANQLTYLHATLPMMDNITFTGILDDAFAAHTPFDFSSSTNGSSPWLERSPCVGSDDNLSFDDFL
ncbi:B3 domain-containing transcription factor FUS3-like isoform X2 [Aristolochia californica]|uniref:B3 domain-containing transcription factor FUS3-like isoform X2 n=1 Tax=Aristolochia californica TaxID=171875 RepID=UPI0035DEA762